MRCVGAGPLWPEAWTALWEEAGSRKQCFHHPRQELKWGIFCTEEEQSGSVSLKVASVSPFPMSFALCLLPRQFQRMQQRKASASNYKLNLLIDHFTLLWWIDICKLSASPNLGMST